MKGKTMKTISTSITLIIAAALLVFASVCVQAADAPAQGEGKSHHEGPPPAAGEVVKLTADSIEIKDHKGIIDTFTITADTKYGTKEKPAKPEDFKEGDHVLVSYTKADGKMTANVIRELPPHHHHHHHG
jgi:Cu/Ag efflux protein CusF